MEKTNNQQNETVVREGIGALELCIDHDHITITVNRFEELVKAEALLDIIRRMYETTESYSLASRLESIFGPQPELGDKNAK